MWYGTFMELREEIERLRNDYKASTQEWRYGQTIADTARNKAYARIAQELDDVLFELDGGEFEEDPTPWVYEDGTRQSGGPGHDSVYGFSRYQPRKIRKVNDELSTS